MNILYFNVAENYVTLLLDVFGKSEWKKINIYININYADEQM